MSAEVSVYIDDPVLVTDGEQGVHVNIWKHKDGTMSIKADVGDGGYLIQVDIKNGKVSSIRKPE